MFIGNSIFFQKVEWTCYYCAKVSEENKRIIKEAVERKFGTRIIIKIIEISF